MTTKAGLQNADPAKRETDARRDDMNHALTEGNILPGLLAHDDVLPALMAWQAAGRKVILVTLAAIEGGSPRSVGAQMAVCEDGGFAGYLSGGCIEQAIVLEALAALEAGSNRMVRYGKGSPFFDVQLPCGSGLDIYFDCGIDPALGTQVQQKRAQRQPFALVTSLASGRTRLSTQAEELQAGSRCDGDALVRVYLPPPRLVLFGAGPAVSAIGRVAAAVGMEAIIWAGDDATRSALGACALPFHESAAPTAELISQIDDASAVVLAFHEHVREPEILGRVLASNCFYIGVLGNHAVHRKRLEDLAARGVTADALARIHAPIGAIPQAKGQATLAIGVLAEILTHAKAKGLVV